MCNICDGSTLEELMERLADDIDELGYVIMGVEPDLDHPSWVYTIGLADEFGHPELSVLGLPLASAQLLLKQVARFVVDLDEELRPGETAGWDNGLHIHLEAVGPSVTDGEMFNVWREYYDWRGGSPPVLAALELLPCGSLVSVLARETDAAARPNRAARRAQARQRHHG